MNFHPNAWDRQEMTPDRVAAWFKAQSDEQIAILTRHQVWYGETRTNPWRKRRRMQKLDLWHQRACRRLPGAKKVSIAEIVTVVARLSKIAEAEMKSPRRADYVVRARQAACFLASRYSGHSLGEIGRHVGGRDHSTVLHSKRRVQADLDSGGSVFGPIIAHVERELGVA